MPKIFENLSERRNEKFLYYPHPPSPSPFFSKSWAFGVFFPPIIQEIINEKVKEGPEQPLLFGSWQEDRTVQPGIFRTKVQTPLSFPATKCKFKKNNFNVKVQLVAL